MQRGWGWPANSDSAASAEYLSKNSQWQVEYPTDRKMGLFSALARSKASVAQGYQSTGLCACCSRYGLCSLASRLLCVGFSGCWCVDIARPKQADRRRLCNSVTFADGCLISACARVAVCMQTDRCWRSLSMPGWLTGDPAPSQSPACARNSQDQKTRCKSRPRHRLTRQAAGHFLSFLAKSSTVVPVLACARGNED